MIVLILCVFAIRNMIFLFEFLQFFLSLFRYLCEFIYYTSLNISRNTIFVHIPPVDQPYSANEMAKTLATIISSALRQMKS